MKKFVFLAGVILLLMSSAGDASACTCLLDVKQSVAKQTKIAYQSSAAVFYGEVTEIARQDGVIAKFKVEKFWKGQLKSEVIVGTAKNSSLCGYDFEIGKKYLVYAYGSGSGLATNICTKTSPSDADSKYLNKIKKPVILQDNPKEKINK